MGLSSLAAMLAVGAAVAAHGSIVSGADAQERPATAAPRLGSLVRVTVPRLGGEWQVGMYNRIRVEPPCWVVLLFTTDGNYRVRETLPLADLDRLQVHRIYDDQFPLEEVWRDVAGDEYWIDAPLDSIQRLNAERCPASFSVAGPTDMKLVEGATFRMGTDSSEVAAIVEATGLGGPGPIWPEVPSRTVTVGDFYVDSIDVTNAAFAAFVEARPEWGREAADPAGHNGRYLEHWDDGGPRREVLDHPVTFITWQAAAAYCEWRGKRLPTEAEYEWAARDPVNGGEYPWGDAAPHDTLVSWGPNGIDGTVPVASYRPNARGLYDMAGNVWRFTADPWRGSYAEMLAGAGPEPGEGLDEQVEVPTVRRVVRGGSWGANAANLRVRYRDSHRPFDAREMVGFRCALYP